jgi:hypothetical protein
MKKILFVAIAFLSVSAAIAQKKKKNFDAVMNRAGDHIMLQLSSDHWMGAPDSINNHINSLSRGGNIYVMMDRPFKNTPQLSVAFGIGISTSSIFFKTMGLELRSLTSFLPFVNLDTTNHFKKYKLSTSYLEVPVELRYTFDPVNEKKSIKIALGAKVGTLLNAHTKSKGPEDKNGNPVNAYIEKENSKRFVNSTRISATARIGYGHFSLFGSYQINDVFKTGTAASMKLLQVGLTLSGL